ncbi:MAG: hypothetical protein HN350_17125, partial [Phycisphaerales bacterium]|nr:hypothetical protein [Phycisphaerales bacterium]
MKSGALVEIMRTFLRCLSTTAAVGAIVLGVGNLVAQEQSPTTRPAAKPEIAATPPALTVPKTAVTPPAATPEIKTVSNVFVDTDLREALSDIASQLEVVVVPDSSVSGVVTCELKDALIDQALEIVLAGTGYVVKKMPSYYLVCSADPDGPAFSLVSKTVVVKPNYVKAPEALKLLSEGFQKSVKADTESNTLCITAVPDVLDRILADLKLIDRPT